MCDIFELEFHKDYILINNSSFKFNWYVLDENNEYFELQRKAIFDLVKIFNPEEYKAIYFSDYGEIGNELIDLIDKKNNFEELYDYISINYELLLACNIENFESSKQNITNYPVIYDNFVDM